MRARNEGTITQRKDGRWEAKISLGRVNGRPRRKSLYGATQEEVATLLKRAHSKAVAGAVIKGNERGTVGAYLDAWLVNVSVKPKTRRQYEQVVRLYLKPAIGTIQLTRLEPDHVRTMCHELEAPIADGGKGLSKRTATLARDILRIPLGQAVEDGTLARNVAKFAKRPKPTRRVGSILTLDEARALFDILSLGHRLDALITVGAGLGLRLGEALGLQWRHVEFTRNRIAIRQACQTHGKRRVLVDVKSKESRRTLPMPAFVLRALQREKARQAERRLKAGKTWQASDFVFTTQAGRPLDGTHVTRDVRRFLLRTWIGGDDKACPHTRARDQVVRVEDPDGTEGQEDARRVCRDCGATQLPGVGFHALRHSCATVLLAAGVPMRDVSEHLGHSDVRLTLDTYGHVLHRERMGGTIDRVFDGGALRLTTVDDTFDDSGRLKTAVRR